jgi:hypothetical protein
MQPPALERLSKGGLPTEAMVAYVLVAKYARLYRQARMLAAQGLAIKRRYVQQNDQHRSSPQIRVIGFFTGEPINLRASL